MTKGLYDYRAVEAEAGRWTCHRGLLELDAHDRLVDAIVHLRTLARQTRPAQTYLHYADGRIERATDA